MLNAHPYDVCCLSTPCVMTNDRLGLSGEKDKKPEWKPALHAEKPFASYTVFAKEQPIVKAKQLKSVQHAKCISA
ncbi:hypothetical protein EH228_03370 [Erwinia endophytica]|uniref:hypothetical protein n=1 Tax=Erwinia endophytica TaxID=1563158 RepID=UPI001265E327|nr:hypothetical protein [Erwinia endophytica]KAB8313197.1 hypothetical protein EH228_03370 [Erwinia endophytica]